MNLSPESEHAQKLVVIIDDDEDSRFMVRYHLHGINDSYEVLEIDTAVEALNFFKGLAKSKTTIPELILVDINMTGMSGFEFLDEYQKLLKKNMVIPLKFVMYTSSEFEKDVLKAQCYEEVVDYIVKPVSKGILQDLLSHKG